MKLLKYAELSFNEFYERGLARCLCCVPRPTHVVHLNSLVIFKFQLWNCVQAGCFNFLHLLTCLVGRWISSSFARRIRRLLQPLIWKYWMQTSLPCSTQAWLSFLHGHRFFFGVSQVTGPHCWFCCALGCILGITVFSPYVETIVEHCIDKILLVFKVMGVKLVKGGET